MLLKLKIAAPDKSGPVFASMSGGRLPIATSSAAASTLPLRMPGSKASPSTTSATLTARAWPRRDSRPARSPTRWGTRRPRRRSSTSSASTASRPTRARPGGDERLVGSKTGSNGALSARTATTPLRRKPALCGGCSRWAVPGSNQRPPGCKPGALPTELTARVPRLPHATAADLRGCGSRAPLRRRRTDESRHAREAGGLSSGVPPTGFEPVLRP